MKISDAMHLPVNWVSADTLVSHVTKMMAKDDVGAIPVGNDDKLIGMITDRNIARWVVADGREGSQISARCSAE
jgi:predicted transcriptional regulator